MLNFCSPELSSPLRQHNVRTIHNLYDKASTSGPRLRLPRDGLPPECLGRQNNLPSCRNCCMRRSRSEWAVPLARGIPFGKMRPRTYVSVWIMYKSAPRDCEPTFPGFDDAPTTFPIARFAWTSLLACSEDFLLSYHTV